METKKQQTSWADGLLEQIVEDREAMYASREAEAIRDAEIAEAKRDRDWEDARWFEKLLVVVGTTVALLFWASVLVSLIPIMLAGLFLPFIVGEDHKEENPNA